MIFTNTINIKQITNILIAIASWRGSGLRRLVRGFKLKRYQFVFI